MKRSRPTPTKPTTPTDLSSALATLPVDALRELVHDLLADLAPRAHARALASILARATRQDSGWTPSAVSNAHVAQALAFATTARRVGYADPSDVDHHLGRAGAAFLRRDYATAHQIFAALLLPIGDGSIDLGQDELVDDVLGVEVAACATQYVVSAYMLAPAADRAAAVRAAIDQVHAVGNFWEPLRELERTTVEPLPGVAAFLPRWRALLEAKLARKAAGIRSNDWDHEEDHWLREVVLRIDGPEGLATLARSSRRSDDLRVWCQSLVDANDWHAAREAFIEAAELIAAKDQARGEFLDGAALAAQQLERSDLPAHLERAWRSRPSVSRLRRWLGSSTTKAALGKRVDAALAACPKHADRQRALLLVLSRDFVRAAKLLAAAPGIGWSDPEHPGHLLFPIFARLLGAPWDDDVADGGMMAHRGMDFDELDAMSADPEAPHLATPEVDALLEHAGITDITDAAARAAVLAAMREAAELRIAAVVEHKRRGHYADAAVLVAACVACDETPITARWAAALRAQYKRYPALRHALDRAAKTP